MLVPLRNACWIFVKLSNKLCVCKFIFASTYLPNGCKDTKKYSIYHSFLMKKFYLDRQRMWDGMKSCTLPAHRLWLQQKLKP